jgi:hypothetical protein
MFLTCNVIDLNFDGESIATSPIGEVGGISLLTFFAHEAKPIWLELITLTLLCFLLKTNVELDDLISICFRPDIMVPE